MYVSLHRPMRTYVIVAHFDERNTSYVQSWTFDPTTLVRVQCTEKCSNLLLKDLAAICAWESSCTQESKWFSLLHAQACNEKSNPRLAQYCSQEEITTTNSLAGHSKSCIWMFVACFSNVVMQYKGMNAIIGGTL